MTDLIQMIKDLEKQSPGILKKLDEVASNSLQKDKVLLHSILVKDNEKWKKDEIDAILIRQHNSTLDINWNSGEYRYRIVVSKRKLEKEKEKNGNNNQAPGDGTGQTISR